MSREKTLDELIKNIDEDIREANSNQINELYISLNNMLNKYDNDKFMKNLIDILKKLFRSKRQKCKLILEDLIEEIYKPNFTKKEELRKELLEISNIHRSFLENLIALLENL